MINRKFRNVSEETKEYSIDEVIQEIINFIKQDEDMEYRLIVGSDSLHRTKKTTFSTAIVIHRVGKAARFWYTKYTIENYPRAIVPRIMKEVGDSIEIISYLQNSDVYQYVEEDNWQVDIDCGNNGQSEKVIKEALSYVKAMGFNGEIKPNACVGSHVADRMGK
jgi:uncharacterized protein